MIDLPKIERDEICAPSVAYSAFVGPEFDQIIRAWYDVVAMQHLEDAIVGLLAPKDQGRYRRKRWVYPLISLIHQRARELGIAKKPPL